MCEQQPETKGHRSFPRNIPNLVTSRPMTCMQYSRVHVFPQARAWDNLEMDAKGLKLMYKYCPHCAISKPTNTKATLFRFIDKLTVAQTSMTHEVRSDSATSL